MSARWLLLAYQVPATPSNARVKTWRRLQELGAVAVRGSVYALPNTDASREDFEWLRTEIAAHGGEATVFAADALDPAGDAAIEDSFRRARGADYAELTQAAVAALKEHRRARSAIDATRAAAALADRLERIRAIDHFHAPAGDAAADAVAALAAHAAETRPGRKESVRMPSRAFVNRRWVTRPRPGVDRMASAWLIRRYIDPQATFAFAAAPSSSDVPFDMYTGEFSHAGGRCTFEVLARRFEIADPAVARLGHIVHDLDLKEDRYGAPEAAAVGRMVEGLRQLHADDATLLEQGMAMFEALARSFGTSSAAARRPKRTRR